MARKVCTGLAMGYTCLSWTCCDQQAQKYVDADQIEYSRYNWATFAGMPNGCWYCCIMPSD